MGRLLRTIKQYVFGIIIVNLVLFTCILISMATGLTYDFITILTGEKVPKEQRESIGTGIKSFYSLQDNLGVLLLIQLVYTGTFVVTKVNSSVRSSEDAE